MDPCCWGSPLFSLPFPSCWILCLLITVLLVRELKSRKRLIGSFLALEFDLSVVHSSLERRGNPPELARRRRKAGSIRLAEWKALDGPNLVPQIQIVELIRLLPLAEPGDSVASSSLVSESSDPFRVGQRTLPADTGRCVRGCLGNIHPR